MPALKRFAQQTFKNERKKQKKLWNNPTIKPKIEQLFDKNEEFEAIPKIEKSPLQQFNKPNIIPSV